MDSLGSTFEEPVSSGVDGFVAGKRVSKNDDVKIKVKGLLLEANMGTFHPSNCSPASDHGLRGSRADHSGQTWPQPPTWKVAAPTLAYNTKGLAAMEPSTQGSSRGKHLDLQQKNEKWEEWLAGQARRNYIAVREIRVAKEEEIRQNAAAKKNAKELKKKAEEKRLALVLHQRKKDNFLGNLFKEELDKKLPHDRKKPRKGRPSKHKTTQTKYLNDSSSVASSDAPQKMKKKRITPHMSRYVIAKPYSGRDDGPLSTPSLDFEPHARSENVNEPYYVPPKVQQRKEEAASTSSIMQRKSIFLSSTRGSKSFRSQNDNDDSSIYSSDSSSSSSRSWLVQSSRRRSESEDSDRDIWSSSCHVKPHSHSTSRRDIKSHNACRNRDTGSSSARLIAAAVSAALDDTTAVNHRNHNSSDDEADSCGSSGSPCTENKSWISRNISKEIRQNMSSSRIDKSPNMFSPNKGRKNELTEVAWSPKKLSAKQSQSNSVSLSTSTAASIVNSNRHVKFALGK